MRYDIRRATDDWELTEIVLRGGRKRPCSDAYSKANDDELGDIFAALRKLRASGFPPDRNRGNPEIETHKQKCKGEHKARTFAVLKAKPSGWRLYFYIKDRDQKQAEFLYAVHKKRWKRDEDDWDRCCSLHDASRAPDSSSERLHIPDR